MSSQKIISFEEMKSRINSYETACNVLGQKPLDIASFSSLPEDERQYHLSEHRLLTVCKAFQQNRKFDYNDSTPKYFPVWDRKTYNDGRENDGFVLYSVGYFYVSTLVGSRLCSFSREEAEYIAEICLEDYRITQTQ